MASPVSAAPRRRRRKRTRHLVLAVVAVCAVAILAIPVTRYFGLIGRSRQVTTGSAVRQFHLVLSEAALAGEGENHYIAGKVRNNSSSRYQDVEVSFTVRDRTAAVIGTMVAKVKWVGPRATAAFQSEPAPPGAFRIVLREITGTQQ